MVDKEKNALNELSKDVLAPGKSFTNFLPVPKDFEQAKTICTWLSTHGAEMLPKDYKGKPGNILVAAQMGSELGLPFMTAIQSIAVINGRGSIWGDAMLGLVKSDSSFEFIEEEIDETDPNNPVAICRLKKKGEKIVIRRFSKQDAVIAGLWGKKHKKQKKDGSWYEIPSPWTQYPKRMLQMRARSWALRDVYPHILKGLSTVEEMRDIEVEAVEIPREEPKPSAIKDKIAEAAGKASPSPVQNQEDAISDREMPTPPPAPPTDLSSIPPTNDIPGETVPWVEKNGQEEKKGGYLDIDTLKNDFRSAADVDTLNSMYGLIEKVDPSFLSEAKRAHAACWDALKAEERKAHQAQQGIGDKAANNENEEIDELRRRVRMAWVALPAGDKTEIRTQLLGDGRKTFRVDELSGDQLESLKKILISGGHFTE